MANAPESNAAVVPPPRRRRAPRSRSMPDPERPIQQQREIERRRQAYFEDDYDSGIEVDVPVYVRYYCPKCHMFWNVCFEEEGERCQFCDTLATEWMVY